MRQEVTTYLISDLSYQNVTPTHFSINLHQSGKWHWTSQWFVLLFTKLQCYAIFMSIIALIELHSHMLNEWICLYNDYRVSQSKGWPNVWISLINLVKSYQNISFSKAFLFGFQWNFKLVHAINICINSYTPVLSAH